MNVGLDDLTQKQALDPDAGYLPHMVELIPYINIWD